MATDVTGQEGGPSPEEQARVDAEQRELIETILAERRLVEAQAANQRRERDRAAASEQQARQIKAEDRLKDIESRLGAIEKALGR